MQDFRPQYHSLIMIILMSFLTFFAYPVKSATTADQAILDQELDEIGDVYRVIAPNDTLMTRAAISFHANLLESDKSALLHVMTLNQEEILQLENFGFEVTAYLEWKDEYKLRRQAAILQQESTAQIQALDIQQSIPGYPCYPTVEDTFRQAENLAANYPQLASWIDIGDSWEKENSTGGYDLMVLKIGNQSITGDKPRLFIQSAIHAREYTTAALTLEFATQLLESYGTDADTTWVLDWHEIHILFQMNPDGRKQAESGLLWRKNTNINYCGVNSTSRGADLNRNFSHFWNITGGVGSSSNQCSETYRGPFAASEPEVDAVEQYIRSLYPDSRGPSQSDPAPADTSGIHLDVHSYSELVLWPYGHTYAAAPNATALQTLGRKLAFWNGYTPSQSIGLYPTDGTSNNISYGELGVAAFTFELGTAFFQSCNVYENTIRPDNLPALMYAAKVVRAPYLTPAGPEVISLSLLGQANATVTAGTQVALSANVDDGRYQNNNGVEPVQNVTAAEYYVDTPPWEAGAVPVAMNAADGNFNNSSENISASIDTSQLSTGQHIVYVRAQDGNGNWGAVTAGFLTIDDEPAQSVTVDFEPVSTGVYGSVTSNGYLFSPVFNSSVVIRNSDTKALQPRWGDTLSVSREDAANFDLNKFDYRRQWSGASGTVIITGFQPDGGTLQDSFSYDGSTTTTTKTLGWSNLYLVQMKFQGTAQLDNFEFSSSTTGGGDTVETFESIPTGTYPSIDTSGLNYQPVFNTSVIIRNTETHALQPRWGDTLRITPLNSNSFDMTSFDFRSQWANVTGTVTINGLTTSGSQLTDSFSYTANNPTTTHTLDWTNLSRLDIRLQGTLQLDNFKFR